MTDRIKKIIAVTITAILVFTGCGSESAELESLEEGTTTTSAAAADETTTTAKATETEETQNVPKPEEASTDKVEETTTSAITTAAPVVTTTTTAATTTQTPVTTTTTTVTTTKPVETTAPAPTHNCDRDGHKWSVEYVTSEPKWCEEVHDVLDCGYDATAAGYLLGVSVSEAREIFHAQMDAIGVDSGFAATDMAVKIWGTETYEVKTCEVCGAINTDYGTLTINPMGEWQYKNGNPRINDPRLTGFQTLYYDPYNVPQAAIDSMELYLLIIFGMA